MLQWSSGADTPGGQGGHGPPGGRETFQPEVKASKSDKRLRSYGHLKKTINFHMFSEINNCLKSPLLKNPVSAPWKYLFRLEMPQQGSALFTIECTFGGKVLSRGKKGLPHGGRGRISMKVALCRALFAKGLP